MGDAFYPSMGVQLPMLCSPENSSGSGLWELVLVYLDYVGAVVGRPEAYVGGGRVAAGVNGPHHPCTWSEGTGHVAESAGVAVRHYW